MVRRNDMTTGVDDVVTLTQSLQGKGSALAVGFRYKLHAHYLGYICGNVRLKIA